MNAMTDAVLRHWRLQRDAEGIAWATLDRQGASANTLNPEVLDEFVRLLDALDRQPPRALVIRSGKEAGFIAGADIEEFTRIDTPAAARALVQKGWDTFERLAAVRYNTVALVRGHCLGGGLELALACRQIVAVDESATKFALPEVMLGIVPGWGGMKRLPQRVGPAAALDMMLTGKNIDAKRAKKMGLVDECVPPRVMDNAARLLALQPRARRALPLLQRLMLGPLSGLVAAQSRKQVAKKARPEHYPAPYAIIDITTGHRGNALAVPAGAPGSVEALMGSPTSRNLVRVFFLQERLKGFGKDAPGFAPRHVHVVGAGVMGGDIAALCALRGMTVTLQDQSIERIAPAIQRAAQAYKRRFRGDDTQVRFALDRLIPDPQGGGVARADVIIEAIFENLEAKHALFRDLEARARPDAVLATNTSSLKLEDIGAVLRAPQRLVGIHFFNPVAMMPLVEVVSGTQTDPGQTARAAAFVRRIDKLPLPVSSAPGFLVNAVLGPYLLEALRCADEGIAPETIDAAALAFGMPMGPVELADTVGLDIAMATGQALTGATAAPKKLQALVDAGKLGKKTGAGFYTWTDGRAQKARAGSVPAGLAARLVQPLLDATRRCVEQGVVADEALADAGVIFGTGFAPYTGGPLNYVRNTRAS